MVPSTLRERAVGRRGKWFAARIFTALVSLAWLLMLFMHRPTPAVRDDSTTTASSTASAEASLMRPQPPPSAAVLAILPRNVPCIELSALALCLPGHLQVPWTRSSDEACIERGVTEIDSELCTAARRRGDVSLLLTPFSWEAVVFGFPIHNSESEEKLIKTASTTWLPLVGRTDVILSTEQDDPRPDKRLVGLLSAAPGVRVHVHRCELCCSGGRTTPGRRSARKAAETTNNASGVICVGVREGWRARSKVMTMISAVSTLFGKSVPLARRKRFFVKLDADTLLHPGHMLPLLRSLAPLADAQPLLLGLAACRSKGIPELCHAAGGAGYALSIDAVDTLRKFVVTRYDTLWLKRLDNLTYGGEDVAVALALKEETGASVIHCGGFHQHGPQQYKAYHMDGIVWPRVRPISFHTLRFPATMRTLFWCSFYFQPRRDAEAGTLGEGPQPRCFVPSAERLLRSKWRCSEKADEFLPEDETCVEPSPNRSLLNPHSISRGAGRGAARRINRRRATGRARGARTSHGETEPQV
jgi:hypothetical protein